MPNWERRLRLLLACFCFAGCFQLSAFADPKTPEELKTFYAYDAFEPLETSEAVTAESDFLRIQITYSGYNGASVPALFYRPKDQQKYPVVVILHGLGQSKEQMLDRVGKKLAESGIGAFAIDTIYQKSRAKSGAVVSSEIKSLVALYKTTVIDTRRAADYLKTRSDVDMKKLGLMGYSLGANITAVASGVDNRYKVTILMLGGDTARYRAELPGEDDVEFLQTSLYVPLVVPRWLIMANSKNDPVVKLESAQKLFDAAGKPKQIFWSEVESHSVPDETQQEVIDKLLEIWK